MKKKYGKGYLKMALGTGLCVALAMSMAACGKSEQKDSQATTDAKEYVYVPEFVTIADGNGNGVNQAVISGDKVYYSQYTYDDSTGAGLELVYEYSVTDAQTKELSLKKEDNASLTAMTADEEGNLYAVMSVYHWDENNPDAEGSSTFELMKYDSEGTQLFDLDITDTIKTDDSSYVYVQYMVVDNQGNIYMATGEGTVVMLDSQGVKQGTIEIPAEWLNALCAGKDGKVYVVYYDNSSTGGNVLAAIDSSQKKLGDKLMDFPNGGGGLSAVSEDTFLISDSNQVYEYKVSTQETETLFNWVDCDVNGSYVEQVSGTEDGKIVAVTRNWETNQTELVTLTKTKASEVVQKEQIVIATMYQSQQLQAAAVDFNKTNDKYRVTIKSYLDYNNMGENSYNDALTSLNNDLTSKTNCPDIIDLSSLNIEQLTSQGAIEDLTPYLEKSSAFSKDDFMDSVLEAGTYDGKLLTIPSAFSLSTVVGKSSIVGDTMGWSVDDMIACADKYPDAALFADTDKGTMLYYLMAYNQSAFIDWESGKCNFDTDEFKKMLEFVNLFPDAIDWSTYDGSSNAEKLANDEILLDNVYLSDFNDIQMYPAMFNADVTFVGYPTMDGSNGCILQPSDSYGMVSNSANKEGAWAFLESYISSASKVSDSMWGYGFSSMKAEFDKQLEKVTTVDYMKDENGENILDEDGNPIPTSGVSSISMDGWEYTYHAPTEEDIEIVKELIADAKPAAGTSDDVIQIIQEEAEAYFKGQKSVDEVVNIIQSRIQIFVSENS